MKEYSVRGTLMAKLQEHGAWCTPVENAADVGMPDVHILYDARDMWVEIKYARTRPVRESTPLFGKCLKPSQRIWFKRRVDEESAFNTFFFVRSIDEYYLLPGKHWELIETGSEKQLYDTAMWYAPVRQAKWNTLLQWMLESTRQGYR